MFQYLLKQPPLAIIGLNFINFKINFFFYKRSSLSQFWSNFTVLGILLYFSSRGIHFLGFQGPSTLLQCTKRAKSPLSKIYFGPLYVMFGLVGNFQQVQDYIQMKAAPYIKFGHNSFFVTLCPQKLQVFEFEFLKMTFSIFEVFI